MNPAFPGLVMSRYERDALLAEYGEPWWFGRLPERASLEHLTAILDEHRRAEADSLTAYGEMAASADDPVVQILMRLLLEDEAQHTRLLSRMVASLRDELAEWTGSDRALPYGVIPDAATRAELLGVVNQRLREEHAGGRELRAIAREQKDLYEGELALLLNTIALDSEKHERILRFLKERLEDRA